MRLPFIRRFRRKSGEGRVWGAILDRVLRRPLLSAVAAGALLVALALPALQLHTTQTGIEGITTPVVAPVPEADGRLPGHP